MFPVGDHPGLRFLDASGSGLTCEDVVNNTMMIHLSLAQCPLTNLSRLMFPSLHYLDLSRNKLALQEVEHFSHLSALQFLNLASNPLMLLFHAKSATSNISSSLTLDLSVLHFTKLMTLNLSDSGVEKVVGTVSSP